MLYGMIMKQRVLTLHKITMADVIILSEMLRFKKKFFF